MGITGDALNTRVAERVQAAMAKSKTSQLLLSELTNIPRTTLLRRLSGRDPFKVNELAEIAAVLDCPLESLLADEQAV